MHLHRATAAALAVAMLLTIALVVIHVLALTEEDWLRLRTTFLRRGDLSRASGEEWLAAARENRVRDCERLILRYARSRGLPDPSAADLRRKAKWLEQAVWTDLSSPRHDGLNLTAEDLAFRTINLPDGGQIDSPVATAYDSR